MKILQTGMALIALPLALLATHGAMAADGAQLYQAKACAACHGPDGRSPTLPVYPKIAGQSADYAYNQMRDIKNGARKNGQSIAMQGIMAMVNEEEIRILADWLATQ